MFLITVYNHAFWVHFTKASRFTMFEHRPEENELMDDLSLSGDDLSRNLHDIEICNRVFGSHTALIKALNCIVSKYPAHFKIIKSILRI